tara:strand:+ start:496 stop:1200 length:705 start_codon:yes stop_codon:yes gene_type:complete
MDNELNFETYLFINNKKLIICVIQNTTRKIIYKEQMILDDSFDELKFKRLNDFLDKNIFKVEKILKNFIKNIFIILDSKEFFPIEISIRKDNNGHLINSKTLSYPLNDLKNLCQLNYQDKKIIHMLIENYKIDNKNYSFLPDNLNCDNFSLDVKFICLSKNLIEELEIVLKRYQILINQVLCASYIENFFDRDHPDLFTTASRIISGYNTNEVLLINKTSKNKGFFEKFFDFFS